MTLAFPKYRPGQSLAETRGKARKARKAFEDAEKRKVRARDRRCRWPGCDCSRLNIPLEVAHLDDKGMGGDHGTRSTADNMVLLCRLRHRGPVSLHSGDLRIEKETAAGADGPLSYWQRDDEGRWYCAFVEDAPGVLRRGV